MHGIRNCTLDDLLTWRAQATKAKATATVAAVNREIERRTARRAAA